MTDAVMFDCDGVLVDSETLIAELLVEMANERGGSLTLAEGLEMFHGVQLTACAERISVHLGRAVTREIVAEYPRRSAEVFRRRLTAVDGVEELLESLTVPVCVVTNSARRKALANLEITRLAKYFVGHVYSAADVPRFKPEPDVYLHASAGLGVEPSRCVAIEDSAVGVRSAANAGMAVIGFGRPDLRASGARWTRESMREIADLVHSFE
jgi:HAD superfamily hydrolase (TIGR01509 family)